MTVPTLAGTAVLVKHQGKILLGLRHNSHGAETWASPGGPIEFGETPSQAAVRELLEETGIKIHTDQLTFLTWTNDIFKPEGKHYITLWYSTEISERTTVKAPAEIDNWQWFDP